MSEEFSHMKGTIALILGVLSIFPCCSCGWVLGPIAIVLANSYTSECIISGIEPGSGGKFGKVLGVIGTLLGIVMSLAGIGWTLFANFILPSM